LPVRVGDGGANERTVEEIVNGEFGSPRLNAAVVASFATVARLLLAIGIYGMLAFRTRCSATAGIPPSVAGGRRVEPRDIEPPVWYHTIRVR
jgi:hypothetical protein